MQPAPRQRMRRGVSYLCLVSLGGLALLLALFMGALTLAPSPDAPVAQADVCGKRYVASGDHIPAGHEVSETERYPSHLVEDHLKTYGWCVYNIAKNDAKSLDIITGGQLAQTWNYQPDLITLTVGGENSSIVDLITKCFDKVKDHDFTGANTCAATVYGNQSAYNSLYNNLITTLNAYKTIMAGRPKLIVAVTGYPNPYPRATQVLDEITQLCTGTVDAITSCSIRWAQLPPALTTLDNAIKKLNTTIENAVKPFAIGYQNRFQFVNPYDKFASHVMKMEVTLKLEQVCHLCGTQYQYRDQHSSTQNLGSSDPYFVAGSDGTKSPDYLYADQFINPPVVLERKSQTTKGMGVHPNDKGHKCISDVIWEWDTPEPGVTPLKWKLGIPEQPKTDICQ